jgi:hypothetical protein
MKNYNKIYVAYKPCKKPEVLVQWHEGDTFMNITQQAGMNYYEDEIGYYFKSGELECSAD